MDYRSPTTTLARTACLAAVMGVGVMAAAMTQPLSQALSQPAMLEAPAPASAPATTSDKNPADLIQPAQLIPGTSSDLIIPGTTAALDDAGVGFGIDPDILDTTSWLLDPQRPLPITIPIEFFDQATHDAVSGGRLQPLYMATDPGVSQKQYLYEIRSALLVIEPGSSVAQFTGATASRFVHSNLELSTTIEFDISGIIDQLRAEHDDDVVTADYINAPRQYIAYSEIYGHGPAVRYNEDYGYSNDNPALLTRTDAQLYTGITNADTTNPRGATPVALDNSLLPAAITLDADNSLHTHTGAMYTPHTEQTRKEIDETINKEVTEMVDTTARNLIEQFLIFGALGVPILFFAAMVDRSNRAARERRDAARRARSEASPDTRYVASGSMAIADTATSQPEVEPVQIEPTFTPRVKPAPAPTTDTDDQQTTERERTLIITERERQLRRAQDIEVALTNLHADPQVVITKPAILETSVRTTALMDDAIWAVTTFLEQHENKLDLRQRDLITANQRKQARHLTEDLAALVDHAEQAYNTANAEAIRIGIPHTSEEQRRRAQGLLDVALSLSAADSEREVAWSKLVDIVTKSRVISSATVDVFTQKVVSLELLPPTMRALDAGEN